MRRPPSEERCWRRCFPIFGILMAIPSSIHRLGQEAKKGIEEAREKVARLVHASPIEIVFTGGGTEADNLAIKGAARLYKGRGGHIITTFEHHAVLKTCQHHGEGRVSGDLCPCDSYGIVDPDDVGGPLSRIRFLITVMHANNEVGTIQPIEEIAEIAGKRRDPVFTLTPSSRSERFRSMSRRWESISCRCQPTRSTARREWGPFSSERA